MIRISFGSTFDREVPIVVPGKELPEMAMFTFKSLTDEQIYPIAIISGQSGASWARCKLEYVKLCWRLRRRVTSVDMLDMLIERWSGFNVEYSREHLRMLLLEYPYAKESIFFSYFIGRKEERLKN